MVMHRRVTTRNHENETRIKYQNISEIENVHIKPSIKRHTGTLPIATGVWESKTEKCVSFQNKCDKIEFHEISGRLRTDVECDYDFFFDKAHFFDIFSTLSYSIISSTAIKRMHGARRERICMLLCRRCRCNVGLGQRWQLTLCMVHTTQWLLLMATMTLIEVI